MVEENERLQQEVQSDEPVEDLLAEGEENSDVSANAEQDRLMAMMTSMHDKMNSFLTRLSRVEAARGRPAAKKRRLAARLRIWKMKITHLTQRSLPTALITIMATRQLPQTP